MPEHVTLYHGTSTCYANDIKQHGLKHGKRCDGFRAPSVYVTTSKIRAVAVAGGVADKHGGEALVLELHIPMQMFLFDFVLDEVCGVPIELREDFRTERTLGPELIAQHHTPDIYERAAAYANLAVEAERDGRLDRYRG